MCTLTWWSNSEGYEVFFNRDERKSRKPAFPPAVHKTPSGEPYLCATDGDVGGTWLLANSKGVTLAILNYYEREPDESDTGTHRSRGLLMTDLAGSDSLEAIHKYLTKIDLSDYKAFSIMGFQLDSHIRVWLWRWDGESLKGPDLDPQMPVCSSSFLTAEVVAGRERMLEDMLMESDFSNPEVLNQFHHEDGGGTPNAYTVKMNRPDAQTWSISRLRMTHTLAQYEYESLPPDHTGASEICRAELSQTP